MSTQGAISQKSQGSNGTALWISAIAERYPRLYLCFALAFMALGYFFVFLFPYLVFAGVGALVEELPNVKTMEHWLVVEVWFAIILFCLFLCYQIFQLHFPRVPGLKMSKELAPDLYALVASVRKHTERPYIRNIILTDQYELRIEETPRFGYPLLTSNTLIVGMPMLQTLSEEQFRGEVMRRAGQYSTGRFRPSHWLYRTRLLWCKYLDALQKSKRIGEMPLRWFFSFYAPLFARFTIPAARQDELAADTAVMEWLNDRDYFETVKSSTIAEIFLDAYYWRNFFQSVKKNPQLMKSKLNPFEKLEAISGHLKSKEFRQKWLQGALAADQDFSKTNPALRIRMENIGQSKLRGVPVVDKTAAEACLGTARKNYIPIIDKLWRSTTFVDWKAAYEKRKQDILTVKTLSRKSQRKMLGVKEVLNYAQIAKRLRGDSLSRSIKKIMRRNLRNFWPSLPGWNILQRKLKAAQRANDIA